MADRPVALLFSGGLDSCAAAILLATDHHPVHLLTYDHGHGHLFLGASTKTAGDLQRAFPGAMEHRVISCKALFRRLVTSDLSANYRRYGSRFIWCFGCKLAMHAETVAYCLRHGIDLASDGSSLETRYYVEQSDVGLSLIEGLYTDFGIAFAKPVHRISSREESKRLLHAHGVRLGRAVRDRNPGTQPLCLPGNGIYFLSTFLSIHPEFPEDQVRRFFADKAPLCADHIREVAGRLRRR